MGIFHAYDIRGIYPSEVSVDFAYQLGLAYAQTFSPKTVVVGYDARHGNKELSNALVDGFLDAGINVTFLGFCSTPLYYFAINQLKADGGIMVTASHNPKEYNGFKVNGKHAKTLGLGMGLEKIEAAMQTSLEPGKLKGKLTEVNLMKEYIHFLMPFAAEVRPAKVVIDTSNGTIGAIIPYLLENLNLDVVKLNFEPNGNFPNHSPNPMLKESQEACQKAVLEEQADFGVIFDGDGDRIIFIDEKGSVIRSDTTLSIIATFLLEKNGENAAVVYDLIASKATVDTISKTGGIPTKSKVGIAFMKETMHKHQALVGGEGSGHFYYRDFFGCDNAIITFLLMIAALQGRALSLVAEEYVNYKQSGEINVKVPERTLALQRIKESATDAKSIEEIDGVSVEYEDYWFNVRPSNTEPLIRINLEGISQEIVDEQIERLKQLLHS